MCLNESIYIDNLLSIMVLSSNRKPSLIFKKFLKIFKFSIFSASAPLTSYEQIYTKLNRLTKQQNLSKT